MNKLFEVIHEDADLLVVNKPAGLVCHPTKGDIYSSLISRVRLHLGDDTTAHMINRLDRETSGLVLIGRTDETAKELRRAWELREVQKTYLAIVHGHAPNGPQIINAGLGNDETSIVHIKDCVRDDGSPAQTDYETVRHFTRAEGDFSLLTVRPHTGRKHQIRIHLAHAGYPIVGDKIYGGDELLYLSFVEDRQTPEERVRLILPNHALHATEVKFMWRGEEWRFNSEPEDWFTEFASEDSID